MPCLILQYDITYLIKVKELLRKSCHEVTLFWRWQLPGLTHLINKDMVYSLVHGEMAFTLLLFDQFMRRAMPPHRL
jgi:hypothetical protein